MTSSSNGSRPDLPDGGTVPAEAVRPVRVCFVCTGNICRSPMAEVVLRRLAADAGVTDALKVSSAGTGDWHVGQGADPRAAAALARRGYSADGHRARQFDPDWFPSLDHVIALDTSHQRILRSWAPDVESQESISLLESWDPEATVRDVPDPYYGADADFDAALAQIERACRALFARLVGVSPAR